MEHLKDNRLSSDLQFLRNFCNAVSNILKKPSCSNMDISHNENAKILVFMKNKVFKEIDTVHYLMEKELHRWI